MAFAIAGISSIISTSSMPHDLDNDKGAEKIFMLKKIVRIITWLLLAYIIIQTVKEMMKWSGG